MMALVFLTPVVSILVIALLIYQWNNGDPSWHPYLGIGYVTFGLVVVALAIRHLVRDNAAIRPSRVMNEECRWQPGTSAVLYSAQAAVFLQAHGWRVVSAAEGEVDRVEIIVRKDRWTVALLALGPGQASLSANDLRRLEAMRREAGAGRRAIVSANSPRIKTKGLLDPTSLANVRFEDLPRLEDALGLWS